MRQFFGLLLICGLSSAAALLRAVGASFETFGKTTHNYALLTAARHDIKYQLTDAELEWLGEDVLEEEQTQPRFVPNRSAN